MCDTGENQRGIRTERALGDVGEDSVTNGGVALKSGVECHKKALLSGLQLGDDAAAQLHVVGDIVAKKFLVRALCR